MSAAWGSIDGESPTFKRLERGKEKKRGIRVHIYLISSSCGNPTLGEEDSEGEKTYVNTIGRGKELASYVLDQTVEGRNESSPADLHIFLTKRRPRPRRGENYS